MRKLLLLSFVLAGVAIFIALRNGRQVVRPDLEVGAVPAVSANSEDSFRVGALGWNRFRGPNGFGVLDDTNIPLQWSSTENLAWSAALPGIGASSPVLTETRVFVTACEFERQPNGELAWIKRFVCCFERESGTELWKKEIDGKLPEDPYRGMGLPEHGYATNTPVVDEKHVYAFLGKSGVYCFDMEGNEVWQRAVGQDSNPKGWGSCSSLILCGDSVIVNAAEESNTIFALDRITGETNWEVDSPSLNYAFSTPAVVTTADGNLELVFVLVGEIWGLNPETGKLLWYAETPMAGNVSPCLIVQDDLIYSFGGYRSVGSLCVQAGGRGNVTDSHVKWTSRLTSYISTPVLLNEKLYWVDSSAKFYSQDARTGEMISRGRMKVDLSGSQPIYASALAIGGKIVLQTRRAGVLVMEADDDLTVLHQNILDNSLSNATPAADDGQLFLRSDSHLYCVQAPKDES